MNRNEPNLRDFVEGLAFDARNADGAIMDDDRSSSNPSPEQLFSNLQLMLRLPFVTDDMVSFT